MADWKFYVETYGCRVNQYESEKLRSAWEAQGGVETDDPMQADYILINSCAITGRAERNARNAVFRLRRSRPEAKIILTGCAAQFYFDFKPRKNANWARPDICEPQLSKERIMSLPGMAGIAKPIVASRRSRPVLKLQDGCSHGCAYCIVPQTRGRPSSRSADDILAEARELARAGYGELVLSGINLRHYQAGGDFWDLLAWLDSALWREFGESLRLRISSLDPALLGNRALDILSETKLLAPHLHLSIQHASGEILRKMGRSHYEPGDILAWIGRLAKVWPVMGLGADFLVGFPGEKEADLAELEGFIKSMPFTYAHVFPFSRRQGTAADVMPGQIVKAEKELRARRIRELIGQKKRRFLERQLELAGMEVVFERSNPEGGARGVNQYYAPCMLAKTATPPSGLTAVRPTGLRDGFVEVVLPSA